MTTHLLVAMSTPVEGREKEFDLWYSEHHVPRVLSMPGMVGARRFALSHSQPSGPPFGFTHIALYEAAADDLAATLAPAKSNWGTPALPRSDALLKSTTLVFEAQEDQPAASAWKTSLDSLIVGLSNDAAQSETTTLAAIPHVSATRTFHLSAIQRWEPPYAYSRLLLSTLTTHEPGAVTQLGRTWRELHSSTANTILLFEPITTFRFA